MKEHSKRRSEDIIFEPVSAPPLWHAFCIKTQAYPLLPPERVRTASLVDRLLDAFSHIFSVHPTLWLDTQELHRDGGAKLFSQHTKQWSATMGFAFDPTGEPPRPMQMSDLMDIDYGSQVKLYDRSAIFVSNLTQTVAAYEMLAGRGLAVFLFFASDGGSSPELLASAEAFIERSQVHLQALMSPGAFQGFPFYLPLLSSSGLGRTGAQQLDNWLGDCAVYMREAVEDQEFFLLARYDLNILFESMGMHRLSVADGPVPWALQVASTTEE